MDTDNGQPTSWALPNLPLDRHTTEAFAIVSRACSSRYPRILVELAAMKQYGNNAAADLVTNPDELAEALHDAPKNWKNKMFNLFCT